MATSSRSDWLVPAGLIALSIVPIAAGTFRLVQLGTGAQITPDNARFFAAPWPVTAHLITSAIFCALGAFQFSAGFRRRNPRWHRVAGRILIPCGLVSALSGLWMTQFYPFTGFDGRTLYVIRLLVGSAMAVYLGLGVAAIWRRDFARHRAWMMRAYALGIGAGTQVFTHLPWVLFPSIKGEASRTVFMAAGWVINLAVAEWLIRREHGGQRRRPPGARLAAELRSTG